MGNNEKATSQTLSHMDGQRVMITGGVNGIGKVIAREFSTAGAKLAIVDKDTNAGEAYSAELNDLGGDTLFVAADLRNPDNLADSVARIADTFGGLDTLINNARPFLSPTSFPDNMGEWDMAMDVLLKAPALLIGHALPYLERSSGGSVVNISSTTAFTVSHQPVAYQVAKAGGWFTLPGAWQMN